MTPAAILAAIKDVVILIAIAAGVYILITYGKDIVKVSDLTAMTKQISKNAETQQKWQQEQNDANTKRDATISQVSAAIAQQRAPVFVRGPSGPNPVPGNPSKAGDQPSSTGTVDQGRGIDYRPAINQFELKYETALVDCYAALDKWPN